MSEGGNKFLDNGSGLRRSLDRRSITMSFEAREYLAAVDADEVLVVIGRKILRRNLGLEAGAGAVLVVEVGYEEIGAPILRGAGKEGIDLTVFMVGPDQASNDPFVARLTDRISDTAASIFVGSYDGLPDAFRGKLVRTATGHRRHAHLAGITKTVMLQSVRGDDDDTHRLGETVHRALEGTRQVDVHSSVGTDLRVMIAASGWHHCSSLIPEGGWSYLPGGQVRTAPLAVDGVLIPDGGLFLPGGVEHARSPRMALHFEKGCVTRVDGLDPNDPLHELLNRQLDSKRVGHLTLGTNPGLLVTVGSLLQDRTAPGLHLTLGHAAGEFSGAGQNPAVEIPLFVRRADMSADGVPLLIRGRYARSLREARTG